MGETEEEIYGEGRWVVCSLQDVIREERDSPKEVFRVVAFVCTQHNTACKQRGSRGQPHGYRRQTPEDAFTQVPERAVSGSSATPGSV